MTMDYRLMRRRSDRVVRGVTDRLMVSFCNMPRSRRSPLAVVNVSDGSWGWLNLDGKSSDTGPPNHGSRALCWHEGFVCAAYRTAAMVAEMALLDPSEGFAVRARFPVPAGVHSALSHRGSIYLTTSLENSVYKASVNRRGVWRVRRVWTMPGATREADECHVNGISLVGGRLWVSALGWKEDNERSRNKGGFIYDIERGKFIQRGFHAPHSLTFDGKRAWTCASGENRIISTDGHKQVFPTTYLRGLVLDDGYVYGASSKRRTRSLSTGEATGVKEGKRGECSLLRKPLDGEPERLVDFSDHRDEIYDILPV